MKITLEQLQEIAKAGWGTRSGINIDMFNNIRNNGSYYIKNGNNLEYIKSIDLADNNGQVLLTIITNMCPFEFKKAYLNFSSSHGTDVNFNHLAAIKKMRDLGLIEID